MQATQDNAWILAIYKLLSTETLKDCSFYPIRVTLLGIFTDLTSLFVLKMLPGWFLDGSNF